MPYEVDIGAVLAISIEGRQDNQQVITTLHYRLLDNSLGDGRAAALAMMSNLQQGGDLFDAYKACLCDAVTDLTMYAQWVTPQRFAYVVSPEAPAMGVIGTAPLPANVAQVVTRRGEEANRRSISTLHLPGVPVAAVVGGILDGAQKALLQDFADIACDANILVGGATLQPCAFTRLAPDTSKLLVEGFPQDTVRVMRRRTVGLGT